MLAGIIFLLSLYLTKADTHHYFLFVGRCHLSGAIFVLFLCLTKASRHHFFSLFLFFSFFLDKFYLHALPLPCSQHQCLPERSFYISGASVFVAAAPGMPLDHLVLEARVSLVFMGPMRL